MSLVVKNAYRYPLALQRTVHEVMHTNALTVTREQVDAGVESMVESVGVRRGERLSAAKEYMVPSMPGKRVSRRTQRMAESEDDVRRFLRSYLLDYHLFVRSDVKTWPLIDTVLSWSYTWDTEYGYLVLHLPIGVSPSHMVSGTGGLLEPFSYDGRCGETDSATVDAEEVRAVWDRVVGMNAMCDVGATAQLSGYMLNKAFGLA